MLQSMRSSAKYIWIFLIIFFIGGFLLAETSGLLGVAPVSTNTPVATVNGEEIPVTAWYNSIQAMEQQATQQSGRGLTLDERERLGDEAYEQLVTDVLLRQEYKRRGITVTEREIAEAARFSPPPQFAQSPELQTDGRFDPDKYRRFLSSPAARQEGLLLQLENYYRDQIPRQKLFEQIASDVYISDARLFQMYKEANDSARITYVAFRPEMVPDSEVRLPDSELRKYYDANRDDFERPARAVVSVLIIPRSITASDSAAVRNRILELRQRVLAGEKFEDVARAESADSGSAVRGGSLGQSIRGQFVPEFETAAYALRPGEISGPVLTPFGYHLIKLDSRKGDTLSLRHILLRIQQSESAATATDRRADELARMAASTEDGRKLDEASRRLGIPIQRGSVVETDALTINGKFIPSVGPWAFKGVKPGETSELFDADDGYYLARLDSIFPGGVPSFEAARDSVRKIVARQHKLDKLLPRAQQLAASAARTSLETAAAALNMPVKTSATFTRINGAAEEVGRLNEAIGAAFTLPLNRVSAPIRTHTAIFVMLVDYRKETPPAEWERISTNYRAQVMDRLRDQRVRNFIINLRESAKIEDHRKKIEAATRQTGL